jgi:hypothetical protein
MSEKAELEALAERLEKTARYSFDAALMMRASAALRLAASQPAAPGPSMSEKAELEELIERLESCAARLEELKTLPKPYDLYYAIKNDGAGWSYACAGIGVSDVREAANALRLAASQPAAPGGEAVAWREAPHYLGCIHKRLVQLYEEHPDDHRLREQISDEVDWLSAAIAASRSDARQATIEEAKPIAWIAMHPERGLNFGTIDDAPQRAASRLMMTGVAGNHGWEIVALSLASKAQP